MDPSTKITAREVRKMTSAEAAARYQSSWPLPAKRAALNRFLRSRGELCHEDLLRIASVELGRHVADPGDLKWALNVHSAVCERLAEDLTEHQIAALIRRCAGVSVEIARAALSARLAKSTDPSLRRLYASEIDQLVLLAVRLEMNRRGIEPKIHPSFAREARKAVDEVLSPRFTAEVRRAVAAAS